VPSGDGNGVSKGSWNMYEELNNNKTCQKYIKKGWSAWKLKR